MILPAGVPGYVESDPVSLPELTGDSLLDVVQQLDLSEQEAMFYAGHGSLDTLLQIAHNLGGGLDPAGKRLWLFGLLAEERTLEELAEYSKRYQDSPATCC